MPTIKSIGTAACLAAGLLSMPAMAARFAPAGTTVTATGNISLTGGSATIACAATLVLVFDTAGNAQVTQATFSGSSAFCNPLPAPYTSSSLQGTDLPWQVTAGADLTTVTIQNLKIIGPIFFNCGPANISGRLSGGQLTFSNAVINPGNCVISGTLTTSPAASINP